MSLNFSTKVFLEKYAFLKITDFQWIFNITEVLKDFLKKHLESTAHLYVEFQFWACVSSTEKPYSNNKTRLYLQTNFYWLQLSLTVETFNMFITIQQWLYYVIFRLASSKDSTNLSYKKKIEETVGRQW